MEPDVRAAIERSTLRLLPADRLEALLADAVAVELPRGGPYHSNGTQPPPGMVLSGLIRVYLAAPDGRTLTIRYARQGALLGIAPFFSPIQTIGGGSAVAASRVLLFRPTTLVHLARTDIAIATTFLAEVSERSVRFSAEIGAASFLSLRQRVVRHLLDVSDISPGSGLPAPGPAQPTFVDPGAAGVEGAPPIIEISQQELADAVGSLREVVVRILRDLRDDGLIETARIGIRLTDPARLYALTFPQEP
jgi:CRP/FNR family cyclic AMP-dependent transcriptional regulator